MGCNHPSRPYITTCCTQVFMYGYHHDDVIKWKHFPRNWPFVRGIHRSRWVNNHEAGDLRRHRGHYDVIVMTYTELGVAGPFNAMGPLLPIKISQTSIEFRAWICNVYTQNKGDLILKFSSWINYYRQQKTISCNYWSNHTRISDKLCSKPFLIKRQNITTNLIQYTINESSAMKINYKN